MRGWNKLIILGVLLSVMLIISAVFGSGVIDVSTLSLGGSPATAGAPESSSTEVLLAPNSTIKDYVYSMPPNDTGYRIGYTFNVSMNVTLVTDLLAWQINVSWGNASMLNVNNIYAGEFLNVGALPNYTTSDPAQGLGFVINKTDNVAGYTAMGESILASDTGVSGSGQLVTIEFQVMKYGYTNFTISVSGILPTTLLNSTIVGDTFSSIPFDKYTFLDMNGWFDNRVFGDANTDGFVNIGDSATINSQWTPNNPYERFADLKNDGDVGIGDASIVNYHWGCSSSAHVGH